MIKRYHVVNDFNGRPCFVCSLVKKFCIFSFLERVIKKRSVLQSTRTIKISLREKIDQSSLLGILMRLAGLEWQIQKLFNFVGYSERNPTNRPQRDVIVMRRTHATSMAYRKPMSIFPSPRLYMRWREDVCSLVQNCRNLNYLERAFQPQCREPECLPTHLSWTARAWRRCRVGFTIECSVFNFCRPPAVFPPSFFFRSEYFPFIFDRQYQESPPLCKSYFVVKRAGSLRKKPARRSGCD